MKKLSPKKKAPKKTDVKPPPAPPDNDEKPFDFGGMPSRDLKKNLGCG